MLPKWNIKTKSIRKNVEFYARAKLAERCFAWRCNEMCAKCACAVKQSLQNWFRAFDKRHFVVVVRLIQKWIVTTLKLVIFTLKCSTGLRCFFRFSKWFARFSSCNSIDSPMNRRAITHLSINNFKILSSNVNHSLTHTRTYVCMEQTTRPKLKHLKPFNINYISETCINGKHSIRWIYCNNKDARMK